MLRKSISINRLRSLAIDVNDLIWEVSVIKGPGGRLTNRDIHNYYTLVQEKILKGLENRPLAVVKIDPLSKAKSIDFVDSIDGLQALINEKMLSLYTRVGNKTDYFWVELEPGKNFELSRLKKIIVEVTKLVRSIRGVKKVEVLFSGAESFFVVGQCEAPQDVATIREVLKEKLEEYCEDKKSVTLGVPTNEQLRLNIVGFRNAGSLPVPYSLNEQTGLVVVPIPRSKLDSFERNDACIEKVLTNLWPIRSLSSAYQLRTIVAATPGDKGKATVTTVFDSVDYYKDQLKALRISAEELIADAKKVKDLESWLNFKMKYNIQNSFSMIVAMAYVLSIAYKMKEMIYKGVQHDIKMDIFDKVFYDEGNTIGITGALRTFDPSKGQSLNTYLESQIKYSIQQLLSKAFGNEQATSLSDEMYGDEESRATKMESLTKQTLDVGTLERLGKAIQTSIEQMRGAVATWPADPKYGTAQRGIDLFDFIIPAFVRQVEKYVDLPLERLSREELLEKWGIEYPSVKCLDCGQQYVFKRNWREKSKELEEKGCEKKEAPEHQIDWTDGIYEKEKSLADSNYKYRIGYERAVGSGSNSGNVIIANLRGLSKFAEDEFEGLKVPEAPKELELGELGMEEVKSQKEYLAQLPPNSYEAKRILGRNLLVQSPQDAAIEAEKLDTVIAYFGERIKTDPTTRIHFEQLVEDIKELESIEDSEYTL